MVTAITFGVKVSVETTYQEEHSNPGNAHFIFAYRVTIENLSDHPVQLKRRHWFIFDSNGTERDVEGEGVVGEQPIIAPGASHSYVSSCDLNTDMGSMSGNYLMNRLTDDRDFVIDIPDFELIVPYRLN